MPPDAKDENVTDCPASRFVGVEGDIVGVARAVLIVSVPELTEFADVGGVALSVTSTFALKVFPIMNVFDAKANEFDAPNWFAISVFVMLLKTRKL